MVLLAQPEAFKLTLKVSLPPSEPFTLPLKNILARSLENKMTPSSFRDFAQAIVHKTPD